MRVSVLSVVFARGAVVSCGALLLAACSHPAPGPATAVRWAPDSASVQCAPGPQYARSKLWQFFWGRHYRTVWATPVSAPVLRLPRAVPGGLFVLQAGGSFQSRTLRLADTTGTEYMLRSVDKDASAALPTGVVRTLLGGLMKDQTSAGLPHGAYVAARLAHAAGVYHTNPRLVYLPDDGALRPFRRQYANALYLLEERPAGNQQRQPTFGHSPEVVNTGRVLAKTYLTPRHGVDARAYLRARLLDIWLGDWSRREDQWRWASFREAAGPVRYRPIPRDRDQAFFLFNDGLLTAFIAWCVPKYSSFHATVAPDALNGLTLTARTLDRTLLATLGPEAYEQEADSLVRRLSDAAIAHALRAGPTETQAAIAAQLGPRLQARRAQLPALARRYYQLLAQDAWLVGTDQPERFVLRPTPRGEVQLLQYWRRPAVPDSLVASRVYGPQVTQRLSLYGLGGDDTFEVHGALPSALEVDFYGGAGANQLHVAPGAGTRALRWFGGPGGPAAPAGVRLSQDPHPELNASQRTWLRRYNLRD